MKKLINMEWLKIKGSRSLLIVLGLYIIGTAFVIYMVGAFTFMSGINGSESSMSLSKLGYYAPENIWQSVTYAAGYFKWISGFFVIIYIANEFSYKTLRQNVIDGLQRQEVFKAKFLWILILTLIGVVITIVSGVFFGLQSGSITQVSDLGHNLQFLLYLFLELLMFNVLAFTLAVLVKRSGFSMVYLFIYALIVENLLGWGITKLSKIDFKLPLAAARELIPQPYSKMSGLNELLQIEALKIDMIPFVALTIGYTAALLIVPYYLLKIRDL